MSEYFDWKEKINRAELKKSAKVLKNNGTIVFPTETVYGIGASAISDKAVQKVFEIKFRPENKPINIMVDNIKEICKYANIKSDIEKQIIEKFMPGPITIILEKKENISNKVTAGNRKIGIRIPDNKIALELLKECNIPIVASSANISGKDSGINIEEIKKELGENVNIYIDGGTIKMGEPSTIVEVINNEIVIHRKGKITKKQIEKKITYEEK